MIKTELLNIVMLCVAFVTALIVPFDLFLFAYAFLGPLHYLTEIRWLHTKRYFTAQHVGRVTLLFGLLFILIISVLLPHEAVDVLIIVFFLLAILFVFPINILLFVSILIAILILFLYANSSIIIFVAILLPTLIHVYFFTFIFMIQSAFKNKNVLYWIAPTLHVFFGIICVYGGLTGYSTTSTYASSVFLNSEFDFSHTFTQIGNTFFAGLQSVQQLLTSPQGIAIGRLFAFAYTYHYLNWFIKTRIIGWATMSRQTTVLIIFLWVISLSLYAYNYLLGIALLALLSVLHVILEFPLNVRSIASIVGKSSKT